MLKRGQIRKFLFLSLGFGIAMGAIFPVFASFFTTYKSQESGFIFVMACMGAGIAVGLMSYAIAHLTIISAIKSLYEHFYNISRGDLTGKVYLSGDDAIGRLAEEFNGMSLQLRQIIKGIQGEAHGMCRGDLC